MTTVLGNISQPKAGAPLRVTGQIRSGTADPSADSLWIGVGVTTANVAPATFAGFAHFEGDQMGNAYWPSSTDNYFQSDAGPTIVTQRVAVGVSGKSIPLDANFAAGRYAWLVTSVTNPPVGGTVPEAISSSYHIR